MNIIDLITGTPWWVFVIFIEILVVGWKLSKPQEASLFRLAIMPTIFCAWSLYSLNQNYGHGVATIGLWTTSLLTGALIGWYFYYQGVTIAHNRRKILIAGSWTPLIIFMTFFTFKYVIGFTYATMPAMKTNTLFWGSDILLSAFIPGVLIGRLLHVLKDYYQPQQI